MNKFTENAPVMLIISEKSYNRTAALGSKLKHNDYRSIDIGILSAYITAQAADSGLATCILGWFDESVIKQICKIDTTIRLVIALGYACSDDELRPKKRKSVNELVTFIND